MTKYRIIIGSSGDDYVYENDISSEEEAIMLKDTVPEKLKAYSYIEKYEVK